MWWRKVRRYAAARAELEIALAEAEAQLAEAPEEPFRAGYLVGLQVATTLLDWDKVWEERARARADDGRGQVPGLRPDRHPRPPA